MKLAKSAVFSVMVAASLTACEPSAAPGPDGEAASSATPSSNETVAAPSDPARLSALFDCVREEGGVLLAAHRGGPAPGYPENAIETMAYALNNGAYVMEIDVAESRDGTLFLMHDDSLGRTSTGNGSIADTDWAEISALNLVDNDGKVTRFNPPSLKAALEWAVENDAILELDKKRTTSARNIIDVVRETGAEANVIMITYNDDQALQVARLAPELMMTAGIGGREHEASLIEGGLDPEKLIAWAGTSNPNPGKWRALSNKGIETAFGTLGRPGERLDDEYWADGDPSEYSELVEGGLVLLATDTPYRLAQADGLIGDAQDIAHDVCMTAYRD